MPRRVEDGGGQGVRAREEAIQRRAPRAPPDLGKPATRPAEPAAPATWDINTGAVQEGARSDGGASGASRRRQAGFSAPGARGPSLRGEA
eukprot:6982779-Alexandrium_andersonii.AAC.1